MAVDDHGMEVLKKAGKEVIPGNKGDYKLQVDVISTVGSKIANAGPTIIKSDLTTVEFEIVPLAGQTSITITNLGSIKVHISLSAGVTTSHKFIAKDDDFESGDYAGSVFVIRASGTGSIQIEQVTST